MLGVALEEYPEDAARTDCRGYTAGWGQLLRACDSNTIAITAASDPLQKPVPDVGLVF